MTSSLSINSNTRSTAILESRKNTEVRTVDRNGNNNTNNDRNTLYEKKAADSPGSQKKNEAQKNGTNKKPSELTAIEKYNNRSLSLDIDRDLNIVLAKIIDRKSGEVLKQIPPKETVALMKYLKENPGTLVSKRL